MWSYKHSVSVGMSLYMVLRNKLQRRYVGNNLFISHETFFIGLWSSSLVTHNLTQVNSDWERERKDLFMGWFFGGWGCHHSPSVSTCKLLLYNSEEYIMSSYHQLTAVKSHCSFPSYWWAKCSMGGSLIIINLFPWLHLCIYGFTGNNNIMITMHDYRPT